VPFELSPGDREKLHASRRAFVNACTENDPIIDKIAASLGINREVLEYSGTGRSSLGLSADRWGKNTWLAYCHREGLNYRNPNSDSKQRFDWLYGKSTLPWRFERERLPNVRRVFLTEGESDCLALLAAGLEDDKSTACCASPGTSFLPAWASMFEGLGVTICFDTDVAGQDAALKVAGILAGHASEVLTWRHGLTVSKPKQDCRSVLLRKGANALRLMAQDAVPFPTTAKPTPTTTSKPDPANFTYSAPADAAPELTSGEAPAAAPAVRKSLADYAVNHSETLGMTWEQIDALRPPHVIDQFVRRGEVMLTGAESKSRKSWLVQDAGFSVAGGTPWLADENGDNGFATAQAKVHILDLELNPAEMRFRFAKARGNRFADLPEEQARVTAAFHAYSLDGLNVTDILPIIEEVKFTVKPGDLVIVDCLYRMAPDGNEVATLAPILEMLKRFAAETQAAVILVDHFRKAGDDKARNRFAGSFIKQASASTLVAIEMSADDTLVLNIDARTFHGCPRVHARFDLDSYTFRRVPDAEVSAARDGKSKAESEGWLVALWKARPWDFRMTAADAGERWSTTRQAATPRLRKLVSRGWLVEHVNGPGHAVEWTLEPNGAAIVKNALGLPA